MTRVHVQPGAPDQWPSATRIAERHERPLARELLTVFTLASEAIDVVSLGASLRVNDVDAAVTALRLSRFERLLQTSVAPRLASAVLAGASLAADDLQRLSIPVTRSIAPVGFEQQTEKQTVSVRLDAVNPEAVEWARRHAGSLIIGTERIKDAIRALIVESQANRITVDELARQIRSIVGLDPRRIAAVANFEKDLRRAGVSQADVLRRVTRYAAAKVRERALLIARTESIDALASGQRALWLRAASQGLLNQRKYGKRWLITPDEITCRKCEALSEAGVIPLTATFPGGFQGPPAHPACRCSHGIALLAA